MRAVLIVLLAAVLAVVLVRAVLLHRLPRITVAALVGLLAVLGLYEYRWASSVAALSRPARVVAPQSEGVTCQRLIGTFGYASADQGHVDVDAGGSVADRAFLSYDACDHLFAYLRSDRSAPPLEQVIAVHTLAHEAVHLTGQLAEAATECAALQRDSLVAQALGATPAQADALARRYLAEVYPRMSANYVSVGCRAGGSLDESPDGRWP